jgi:hypothetical protein
MKSPNNINVLMTGCVSGLVHGAAAVISVPVFAAVFLGSAGTFSRATETFMVVAAMAPLAWAVVGFFMGALMAGLHNVFMNAFEVAPPREKVEEVSRALAASQSAA